MSSPGTSPALSSSASMFWPRETSSAAAPTLKALCVAGFVMNLSFVVMTKLHWNFTENTGKPLPKG